MGNRSSVYPEGLDNDGNLGLVVPTTPLVPALHNNHTDAIEAIETVVGRRPGAWPLNPATGSVYSVHEALIAALSGVAVSVRGAVWAYVSMGAGQVCEPGALVQLALDSLVHLGDGFSAVVGSAGLAFGPGVYLALADVYVVGAALGGGYVLGAPGGDAMVVGGSVPCMALGTDIGAGIGFGLLASSVASSAWINARNGDTVAHSLAGDLVVIRLGDM